MKYEVDEDYTFDISDGDVRIFPDGVTMDGNLYVLPNGKYMPTGVYLLNDGRTLIYEPPQLSQFAEMIASFAK